MFAPFANRSSYSGNWAYRFVGEDVIRQNIEDADRAGYDVGVHVIGDKALHELLDWYENAIQKNGPRDRRFRIIHVEFATLADLQRAGRLHMIADITPNLLLSATSSISAMLGPEREKTAFAWRTMIENGVKLDIVSDLPGLYSHEDVSPYAPLENIYYAVTRIPVGGGAPWHPEQALTVREAIEAYTANPAFASHDEANKGTITEGKLADMVVLSQDILHLASPEQIRFTKVVMTVLGGKIVFQAKTE
jgi:predicted amidohydrolase YtcJ